VTRAGQRTRERLAAAEVPVVTVPAAELAKAEGGVTCCSLLVRAAKTPSGPMMLLPRATAPP